MTALTNFYRDQVAQCAEAASSSSLSNQRNKFLMAQAAWQGLADRSARNERAREVEMKA